jgi:hypothetical protein
MGYEEYFLNDKNISQFKKGVEKMGKSETIEKMKITEGEKLKPQKHCPSELDKLFWCFFIAYRGEVDYEHIKMFNKIEFTEKNTKIEFIEKLNKRRSELNKKKLVKSIGDVESNLSEKLNLETLVVLAYIENINILFLFEKSFFICSNSDKSYSVIRDNTIQTGVTLGDIENMKKGKIERCRVDKVLNSISYYKLGDLQEMLPSDKKMTKQQLYDIIQLS